MVARTPIPEASFDDGTRLELYTGTTTVVVFANGAQLAHEAAAALTKKVHQANSPSRLLRMARDPRLSCNGRMSHKAVPLPLSTAGADDSYTQSEGSSACPSHAVDPLNVVWSGPGESAKNVASEIETRLQWVSDDTRDAPVVDHQLVVTRYGCRPDVEQRASDCFVCDRYHIRLFDVTVGTDAYVVGDAHHDTNVFFGGCTTTIFAGHISSSFTGPRDLIAELWGSSTPAAHLAYWGNTRRIRQCDSSMPMNDGYVLEEGAPTAPAPPPPRRATTPPEANTSPPQEARTIGGALQALRSAAMARNAVVCSLLVAVTPGQVHVRLAPSVVDEQTESCIASFGKHGEFQALGKRLAGGQPPRVISSQPVHIRGRSPALPRAIARVQVHKRGRSTTLTRSFVQVNGYWRLAFAPD